MSEKNHTQKITCAQQLLEKHNIRSLPVAVDKIAKAEGAQIRFSPFDEELSGMIYIKDDVPIIGVNALHHPNRQRFTIAHELAHLMLHRARLISGEVHVDKEFPVLMRDATSSTGSDQIEVEANRFAAELLLPQDLLEKELAEKVFDIDNDKPLEELAKKFRVSKAMLEYRIRNLPTKKR